MSKRSKILVTGGTGYIGSHTVAALQERGYEVVIADNLSNSHEFIIDRIEQITGIRPVFYKMDLCDSSEVKSLFDKEPEIVAAIHFAALKAVGESVEKPLEYYHNNLQSLINLLQGLKANGSDRIVFSSSCTVYGEPDTLPVTESSPIKPAMSPYGNTKQIGEEIINDCFTSYKLNAICLRYFNPVGAHPSTLIGELPFGKPNNLVPFITQTAVGKFPELQVFGNDYNTPDGTCIRDYIHVMDVAEAHVAALDYLLAKSESTAPEVFNIGTGRGYTVLEVIKAFESVSSTKLPYKIVGRRAGDIEKVYADTSRSNIALNWKARRGINEMMESAWNWQQKLQSENAIS